MRSVFRLLACIVLCYAIAALGGYITVRNIPTWYAGLAKPFWTPPNAVFPIVWNVLYGMIAVALWLLWDRTAASIRRTRALWLFGLELILNCLWTPVFFGAHYLWMGLVIIVALVVTLLVLIRTAWPIQRWSALLLLPYLAWVSYATTLNAGIAYLNRG
jgi:tryptophan-rich sensory protein